MGTGLTLTEWHETGKLMLERTSEESGLTAYLFRLGSGLHFVVYPHRGNNGVPYQYSVGENDEEACERFHHFFMMYPMAADLHDQRRRGHE